MFIKEILYQIYRKGVVTLLSPVVRTLFFDEEVIGLTYDYFMAEQFRRDLKQVKKCRNRHEMLRHSVSNARQDGLFLEFGVYSGNTINFISDLVKNKKIYGFDSFKGLPEKWRTGFEKGKFKRDEVPKVNSNVKLVIGWFEDTLAPFIDEHDEPISFIHMDADLFTSTLYVLETLKQRKKITKDLIIQFDEYYNYLGWMNTGEYLAFETFINKHDIEYEYIGIGPEQVAVKIVAP
jgi:hypothetical protein